MPPDRNAPQRHVGHHLLAHRAREQRLDLGRRRTDVDVERRGDAGLGDRAQIVVAVRPVGAPVEVDPLPGARRQLADALVDRARRRDVAVAHEPDQRGAIDRRVELRVRAQRLQLRAEHERAAAAQPAEVQRLLAKPIARQGQRAFVGVPHREREHAAQPRQRGLDAPALDRRDDDLGVAASAEAHAGAGQLAAQRAVVVDLAVEHQREAPRRRVHRLVAVRRQIDDRQPPEAEPDVAVGPRAVVVGAARDQRRRHRARQDLAVGARASCYVDEAGDAAHAWFDASVP